MPSFMHKANSVNLSTLIEYSQAVWRTDPLICATTLVLILLVSLMEGVGYLLLIPLLEFFSMGDQPNLEKTGIASNIEKAAQAFNMDFSLGGLLLIFMLILITRALLGYLSHSAGAELKAKFLHQHRRRVHHAIMAANWSFLSRQRTSLLTHALTTQSDIIADGVYILVRGLITIVTTGVVLSIAFILSWKITLCVLLMGALILAPAIARNRRSYKLGDTARVETAALFEQTLRYFKSLKTVKSLSAESEVFNYFNRQSKIQARTSSKLERNFGKATLSYQLLSAVFLVGLVYGALSFFPDQKTEIVILIVIFSRLAPRVNSLQSYAHELAAILPEYNSAKHLSEMANRHSQRVDHFSKKSFRYQNSLALKNVSFFYCPQNGEEKQYILRNVSIEFPAKGAIAIMGPSGAGKTTLIDIICGLLSPTSGDILVDGQILDEADREHLKEHICYISHEDLLFDGSISENLRITNQSASEDAMWRALEKANAQNFVQALPKKLDSIIGDDGVNLSQGQKQRLSLARGLLGNPSFLVLDEATSAISMDDELKILQTLKEISRDIAVIIVSHRESSISWIKIRYRLVNQTVVAGN